MKKMADRNPHTGAALQSKLPNEAYRDNFDAIFRKPTKPLTEEQLRDAFFEKQPLDKDDN